MAIEARGTETATEPSPAPREQSLSIHLHVEIMNDVDDGHCTLTIAAETNLGDLAEVGPSDAMRKLRDARAQLDQAEQLINQYAETVTLPAFIEHYGIELEELDTASLFEDAPGLAALFRAFSAVKNDGSIIVAVPKGQAPVERLAAIRDLVLDLQKRTAA